MNLQEWRQKKQQGETVTLPSGLEVRLRRASVFDMSQQGQIPHALRPTINTLMKQGGGVTVGLDEIDELAEIVDLVAAACLMEPVELEVRELPWVDRQAIYMWANEVPGRLEPFRAQNGKPVDAALPGGDVRATTERPARSRRA